MFENVGRMIERLRRIDRHDDAAREERREIADDPVDAVMRNQRDAIAGLHRHRRMAHASLSTLFSNGRSRSASTFVDALDEQSPQFGERLAHHCGNVCLVAASPY